jgi:hypothetical protein
VRPQLARGEEPVQRVVCVRGGEQRDWKPHLLRETARGTVSTCRDHSRDHSRDHTRSHEITPRSPEITRDHPEITRDHPRSPEITRDHPDPRQRAHLRRTARRRARGARSSPPAGGGRLLPYLHSLESRVGSVPWVVWYRALRQAEVGVEVVHHLHEMRPRCARDAPEMRPRCARDCPRCARDCTTCTRSRTTLTELTEPSLWARLNAASRKARLTNTQLLTTS